jgi:hypothetical protein
MYKLSIVQGATGQRLQIYLRDSSVSYDKPLTGLAFNSAGLSAFYFRDGATAGTAITLVTATVGTFVSGGFKEIDATNLPGLYELDVPDAAFAAGANRVTIVIKGATSLVQEVMEVPLVGNDPASQAWSTAFNNAIAAAVLATAVESGVTVKQMLEAIGAVCAGDYDNATSSFRAVGNHATTRVTQSTSVGNRTNTLTL